MMNILFYSTFKNNKQWLKYIKKRFYKDNIYTLSQNPDYGNIDIAIVWNLPDRILRKLINIKVIFSLGAGVDHIINLPSFNDIKVPVIRIKDKNMAERMCSHVHSQILNYQLKIYSFYAAQNKKKWIGEQYTKLNCDITIGLLGFGFLGKSVGVYLKKLNYNVIAFKKSNREKSILKIPLYTDKNLKKLVINSDIIISILPGTKETKNFINKKFLENMKKNALLVNVGRGITLNEEDLINHLHKNKNFYASLDVFNTEPLPKTSKLWKHRNITITPHVAAITDLSSAIDYIFNRYKRFKKTGTIRGDVNYRKGY